MRAGAGAEAEADAETETETGAREEQEEAGDLSGYLRVSATTRASATWRLQAGQTSGSRPSKSECVIIKYMRDEMHFIMLDVYRVYAVAFKGL